MYSCIIVQWPLCFHFENRSEKLYVLTIGVMLKPTPGNDNYYNNTLLYLYNPKILHCNFIIIFDFSVLYLHTVPVVVTVRCTRCHYIPRPTTNNIMQFLFVFNK